MSRTTLVAGLLTAVIVGILALVHALPARQSALIGPVVQAQTPSPRTEPDTPTTSSETAPQILSEFDLLQHSGLSSSHVREVAHNQFDEFLDSLAQSGEGHATLQRAHPQIVELVRSSNGLVGLTKFECGAIICALEMWGRDEQSLEAYALQLTEIDDPFFTTLHGVGVLTNSGPVYRIIFRVSTDNRE
jgi:hypothetical protein